MRLARTAQVRSAVRLRRTFRWAVRLRRTFRWTVRLRRTFVAAAVLGLLELLGSPPARAAVERDKSNKDNKFIRAREAPKAAPKADEWIGFVRLDNRELSHLWGLRAAVQIEPIQPFNVHPAQLSAPYISNNGELVFAGADRGSLIAYDRATGHERWRRDKLGTIGSAMAQLGDSLLVGVDSSLRAFEAASGQEHWRMDLNGEVAGEITMTGTVAIVPVRPDTYVAVDAREGKQIWRYKRPKNDAITVRGQAPATLDRANGRLFVGCSDGTAVALSLENGDALWATTLAKAGQFFDDVDGRVLLRSGGKQLLAASYSGGLAALEASSGKLLWKDEALNEIVGLEGRFEKLNIVVAALGNGTVVGLDPEQRGKILWRYKLVKGVPTSVVAIGHDIVAAPSSAGMVAFLDVRTGRPLQLLSPGSGGILAGVAVRNADLAFLSNRGLLLILRYGAPSNVMH